MDDLLDEVTGLVGFCHVPKSDESSNDVSDESSEENEDEELDKISIYLCAVWARYFSFVCSIADFSAC